MNPGGVIRWVGLGISRRSRLDLRGSQRVAQPGHGMLDSGPIDQQIGKADDAVRRAPRVGERQGGNTLFPEKLAQMARVSRGKCLEDRLVWIAHAHPVTPGPSQQAQDFLLQPAGVLRFILQHIGPPVAQALQVIPIGLQSLQRKADQVIVIECRASREASFVVGIDLDAHLEERGNLMQDVQFCRQLVGRQLHILGQADEAVGNVPHQLRPSLALDPLDATLLVGKAGINERRCRIGVRGDPFQHRGLQNLLGFLLVGYAKVLCQAQQARSFAHDVVSQPVKRSHPVADAREQAALLDEFVHPGREVVYGRIDQGDDEHLLVIRKATVRHQPRSERGQDVCLAASRCSRDTHHPAAI